MVLAASQNYQMLNNYRWSDDGNNVEMIYDAVAEVGKNVGSKSRTEISWFKLINIFTIELIIYQSKTVSCPSNYIKQKTDFSK